MAILYSVIVPTYKECGNIDPLVRRVFAAMKASGYDASEVEVILVDDNSRDGTVEVVKDLRTYNYNVDIMVRVIQRGLSSAVIAGLKKAHGAHMVVMDADLQHPPETVPQLFDALKDDSVEFVIGTRYGAGVRIDKNWPIHRRVISWGARILARPLTPLSDPMSGFFGLQKSTLEKASKTVSAVGYKIALELFVKAQVHRFNEVSFDFATRNCGESKLTGKVMIHYIKHLFFLYNYKFPRAFPISVLLISFIVTYIILTTVTYFIYNK